MFFYKVEGHMPKLSSFGRGKTIRPKKSLTSLLHAALQLGYSHTSSIVQKKLLLINHRCNLSYHDYINGGQS